MSSVHLGRLRGPAGFGRTVAIKRLHPQFARDPEFVSMMLDEARLVSRITHPSVVATLDVVHTDSDLFLILEYVPGETLAALHRLLSSQRKRMPLHVARGIGSSVLLGLDAAHEAADEDGRPLGIVHRDVSPQNVIVGTDGVARVLDFGIAKAVGSSHQSEAGEVKGKVAYMAPEQLQGGVIGRASDVYGASVVLWEMLTGRRLFDNADKSQIAFLVGAGAVRSARSVEPEVPEDLDAIVMRGLDLEPARRFATARAMATALEASGRVATPREIAAWVGEVARESLAERAARVANIEKDTSGRVNVRELAANIAAGRGVAEATTAMDSASHAPFAAASPRVRRVVYASFALLLCVVVGGTLLKRTRKSSGESSTTFAASPSPIAAPAAPPIASDPLRSDAWTADPASASAPALARPPAPAIRARGPRARPTPTPTPSATTEKQNGLFDRN